MTERGREEEIMKINKYLCDVKVECTEIVRIRAGVAACQGCQGTDPVPA